MLHSMLHKWHQHSPAQEKCVLSQSGHPKFVGAPYSQAAPVFLPDKSQKSLHDEIVQLVETMLQLQQQKQTITLPQQQAQLEQRIAHTDAAINKKVYTLYGLSEEEVRVVEATV